MVDMDVEPSRVRVRSHHAVRSYPPQDVCAGGEGSGDEAGKEEEAEVGQGQLPRGTPEPGLEGEEGQIRVSK